MAETLGELIVRLGLDANTFQKGISDVSRQIKTSNSEFQAYGKAAMATGDNLEVLRVKANSLTTSIELQQKKIDLYQKSADQSRDRIEKLAEAQEALSQKIQGAKSAYEESVKIRGEEDKITQELKGSYEKLNQQYSENEQMMSSAARSMDNNTIAANKAKGALADMNVQLEDTNKKISQLDSSLYQSGVKMQEWGENAQKAGKQWQDAGKSMESVGKTLSVAVTAPIVAIGTSAIKSAMDFETAFTGVTKTIDMTARETEEMRQAIIAMSEELPHTKEQISSVAEAAGQLGIEKKAVLDFTETMLNMGVATNLTANDAADSMARFANIMQMPQDEFENLGSSIVDLGNKFASTEAEILEMGLRIAGAGKTAGMTEGDVLGLANALTSVGINAEMGGSAISRIILTMERVSELGPRNKEVLDATGMSLRDLELLAGNNSKSFKELADSMGYTASELQGMVKGQRQLEDFAEVSGITADQFRKSWEEDAAGALSTFIQSVAKLNEEGTSAAVTLDEMGIKEMRLRDTLLRSTNASDLFTNSIKTGNEAFEENIALTKEAEKFNATAANQMQVLKNRINSIATEIGEDLTPKLLELGNKAVDTVTTKWKGMTKEQKEGAIQLAATVAAIGPVTLGLGKLTSSIGGTITGAGKLISYLGETKKALSGVDDSSTLLVKGLTALKDPTNLATLALGGLVVGLTAVAASLNEKYLSDATREMESFRNETDKLISEINVLTQSIYSSASAYDSNTFSIETETRAAEKLADEIEMLSETENKSSVEKATLQTKVEMLNQSVSGLNLQYDENNNLLSLSNEEIRKQIANQEELLRVQAAQERALGIMKERVGIEIETENINTRRAETTERLADAEQALADKIRFGADTGLAATYTRQQIIDMIKEYKSQLEELSNKEGELAEKELELGRQYESISNIIEESNKKIIDSGKDITEKLIGELKLAADLTEPEAQAIADAIINGFDTLPEELTLKGQESALALVDSLAANGALAEIEADYLKNRIIEKLDGLKTEAGSIGKDAVNEIANRLAESHDLPVTEAEKIVRATAAPFDELPKLLDGKTAEAAKSIVSQLEANNLMTKEKAAELGSMIDAGLIEGIFKGKDDVQAAAEELIDKYTLSPIRDKSEIDSSSKATEKIGEQLDEGLILGIQNKQTEVETIAAETARLALEQIESYTQPFYQAGYNLGIGATDGLRNAGQSLIAEARSMASAAMNAMRDELDEHSPSRVARRIFQYVGEGAVLGLRDEQAILANAARALSLTTAKALAGDKSTSPAQQQAAIPQQTGGDIKIEIKEINIVSDNIKSPSETGRIGREIADSAARKMRLNGVFTPR